jgi:hypothetical protein
MQVTPTGDVVPASCLVTALIPLMVAAAFLYKEESQWRRPLKAVNRNHAPRLAFLFAGLNPLCLPDDGPAIP